MSDVTTIAPTAMLPAPRTSAWTGYTTLLRWQLAQIGPLLPLVVIIQALLAAGLIIGFGFLIPDIDTMTALHLSTGTPTILLLIIGLVIVPQTVSQSRVDGTFAYLRTLPVPRPLLLLAQLTVWALIALPSLAVAVGIAVLRYDLDLAFDVPLLVATAALVTVSGTAVGYMIAVAMPPMLAQMVSQALTFFVLLFSPITFPASQLPTWFQDLHGWLPVEPAADLLRAGLAQGTYAADGRDLLVLGVWCLVAIAVSVRALVRRS